MRSKLRDSLTSLGRNWPALLWVSLTVLGALLGGLIFKSKLVAAVPVILLVAYAFFAYPRLGIYGFLFLAIVYFNFARNEVPALAPSRLAVEFAALILFARALVESALKGKWRFTPAGVLFLLWFLAASLSAYFGRVPLEQFLLKARVFWRFFLVYLALVNLDLDEKFVKGASLWALGLASLNIPFVFKQFRVYGIHDLTRGLTGGSGELLFIVLWASVFLLALHSYRALKARWVFPWMGAFLVLPFLNGVRAMVFYYPVEFLLALALLAFDGWRKAWSGVKLLTALLATAVALVALVPQLNFLWTYFMRTVESGIKVQAKSTLFRYHVGRLVAPKLAHEVIAYGGIYTLLLGYGFGLILLTEFVGLVTKQADFMAITSYLPVSLYETGYLGTALFVAVALAAGWQSFLAWRRAQDPWLKAFALSAVFAAFNFVALLPYYWVWYEHIATSTFWAFSGLAAVLYYSQRDERASSNLPGGNAS